MNKIQLLEKLISFPVLGGQSNLNIIEFIAAYLAGLKIPYSIMDHPTEAKQAIHCRIGPAIDGGYILSGHTDVVPIEGQEWSSDAFSLTTKGTRHYGRGSCDMKGYLACCLASAEELQSKSLKKPIYFAFSYDEEIGCLGAPALIKHIKAHYQEKPSFAIIGEPSMMQTLIGHKGIAVLETKVNGSAGHSSRIKQEVSAIHEAARLVLWLEGKMNDFIDAGHLDSRFDPPHSSIHIGQISGGVAPNIIASSATFKWDLRCIPQDNGPEILQEFLAHCDETMMKLQKVFPGFKITTDLVHPFVPSLDTDENDEIVTLVNSLNRRDDWATAAYAAEAGQFAEAGFSSVICGPGSIAQAHRADEYVEEEQLEACMKMIRALGEHCSK